ncbi:hypothetical protein K4A83_04980 [Spirulina subsalsa FACHB-351]|uniref:Uncharacterized protein n=1 Tax=Spirulina subsalsa FACHB-351 TaxID=234711 RepID=A0ABT3L2A2_9CYAN|nr:hypothetical protein [Spirulina subsalsa]MCW6035626.1 hypothetical protein [Spirulina subsalsa FACHB-351]
MITVQELIEHLQKYDPKMRVVIAGYYSGYNDILTIYPICLQLNTQRHPCKGAHSLAPLNLPKNQQISAIFLGGYNPHYLLDKTP